VLVRVIGLAVILALLLMPLAAWPQQSGKVYRVGWLATAPIPENLHALLNGLRALGYVQGNNLVVEQRYGGGKVALASAAAEIL
jgi:putative ABC transport system substrate-binding protein